MTTETLAHTASGTTERSRVLVAAMVALVAGALMVFTVGFAHPEMVHNAAHDWRHSMNFPCH